MSNDFWRIEVFELDLLPEGAMVLLENNIIVKDFWWDFMFPILISEMKRDLNNHLLHLVASAELRLGLL